MRTVFLGRFESGDQGTKGVLVVPVPFFHCCTLELPWRDNKPSISCIPNGIYLAQIRVSPRFGKVYWVMEVAGRSWILMHSGNFAGDESKGLKSHVEGCILLGKNHATIYGQEAVALSRVTVRRFVEHMGLEPFELHISGVVG